MEHYKKRKLIFTYKMVREVPTFDDTGIGKHRFHFRKSPMLIFKVDVNKIVVSTKVRFSWKGFKYFIGYKND